MYEYVESLDTPKKWFKANAEAILQAYGTQHRIQREDLFLGESIVPPLKFDATNLRGSHRQARHSGLCTLRQSQPP